MGDQLRFYETEIKFKLSPEDRVLVKQAMTVRNIDADLDTVIAFLEAKIAPKDLQQCFEFIQANGNRPNDV
jgi:hypothetical protein